MTGYKLETWCVTSGWHWRVIGETDTYGCELASSNFPLVNQEEAERQGNEWIDKFLAIKEQQT